MQQKNLEIKVGLFVLLGLISVGVLIVSFGRFGELFQKSYQLTVKFENTDGVIKNSQVLYRGARVGTVATSPKIAEQGKFVILGIKVNKDVLIDKQSTFEVGSYGLLGDRFIDVQPPAESSGNYFQDGDVVEGSSSAGMADIMKKVNTILQKIEEEGIMYDFSVAMESIKGITAKLDNILGVAEKGQGPVYTLLNDQETAAELKEMIREFKLLGENLRKRGILFYRDLSEDKDKKK
ncbi:MAG: MlaD family protein [Verrucomicrobiota bacterium]